MPTRLVLRGVLHSFLQTYTSRNSDYLGYWLWGQLVADLNVLAFDLLATPDDAVTLAGAANRRAVKAFAEQLQRSGLGLSRVAQASVQVTRLSEPTEGVINGLQRAGFLLRFGVRVITDTGREFTATRSVFASPHYSNGEFRRSEGGT